MVSTFIDIDAIQFAIVFKASFTSTRGHAFFYGAGAVWATVNAITGVFANKVDTLTIEWTVGIMQTFHFLTAHLMVVSIASVKSGSFRALALHLMT